MQGGCCGSSCCGVLVVSRPVPLGTSECPRAARATPRTKRRAAPATTALRPASSGKYQLNADRWLYFMLQSYTATRFAFNLRYLLGTDIQTLNWNANKSKSAEAVCHRLIAGSFPHPESACDLAAYVRVPGARMSSRRPMRTAEWT